MNNNLDHLQQLDVVSDRLCSTFFVERTGSMYGGVSNCFGARANFVDLHLKNLQRSNIAFDVKIENLSDELASPINTSGSGTLISTIDFSNLDMLLRQLIRKHDLPSTLANTEHSLFQACSPIVEMILHYMLKTDKNRLVNFASSPIQQLIRLITFRCLYDFNDNTLEQTTRPALQHITLKGIQQGTCIPKPFTLRCPAAKIVNWHLLNQKPTVANKRRQIYFFIAPAEEVFCGVTGEVNAERLPTNSAKYHENHYVLPDTITTEQSGAVQGDGQAKDTQVIDREYSCGILIGPDTSTCNYAIQQLIKRSQCYANPSLIDDANKREVAVFHMGSVLLENIKTKVYNTESTRCVEMDHVDLRACPQWSYTRYTVYYNRHQVWNHNSDWWYLDTTDDDTDFDLPGNHNYSRGGVSGTLIGVDDDVPEQDDVSETNYHETAVSEEQTSQTVMARQQEEIEETLYKMDEKAQNINLKYRKLRENRDEDLRQASSKATNIAQNTHLKRAYDETTKKQATALERELNDINEELEHRVKKLKAAHDKERREIGMFASDGHRYTSLYVNRRYKNDIYGPDAAVNTTAPKRAAAKDRLLRDKASKRSLQPPLAKQPKE